MSLLVLALSAALAVIHLLAGHLRFLDEVPRSRWLSFASGTSVAYVFVHLLPELAEGQQHLQQANGWLPVGSDVLVWIVALAGLAVFYGLERAAKKGREGQRLPGGEDKTEREVFWAHMGSYGIYNVLIGYLLVHRQDEGTRALFFFWLAMALHMIVNDYGLRQHHRDQYSHEGRWLLAAAVVGGTVAGFVLQVSESTFALILAFIGGAVVLNVLKEELPDERQSRFWPFAIGAAAYAALLLAT